MNSLKAETRTKQSCKILISFLLTSGYQTTAHGPDPVREVISSDPPAHVAETKAKLELLRKSETNFFIKD